MGLYAFITVDVYLAVNALVCLLLYMQSVEAQLASVGNIMQSEHDIGMYMYVCWLSGA